MDLRLWQARFREYLQIVKHWNPRTIEAQVGELRPFFAFLEAQPGWINLSGLTRELLEAYRAHLASLRPRGRLLSRDVQSIRFDGVKAFVRFLFGEQYLLGDLTAGLESARTLQPLRAELLSEQEVWLLLQSPDVATAVGLRDRAVLELVYRAGLRVMELRRLQLEHVDLGQGLLHIKGRRGRWREVRLEPAAIAWLQEYLLRGRPRLLRDPKAIHVFLRLDGAALDHSCVPRLLNQCARKAGLPGKTSPRALRHACAVHRLEQGTSAPEVEALLGHAYTRAPGVWDLADVLDRYHPLECRS